MSRFATFLLLAATSCASNSAGSPEFRQACLDATTDVTILNLAAHPDDEAARTLVYLRRRHGFRTFTLYSTCGEGGQNAIGSEIGAGLARIRTRETLRAAAITGAQVGWLGYPDFGFSKRADETFEVWSKEAFSSDLRSWLDRVQPSLTFTNHSPVRGHGHHRASAAALRELSPVPNLERMRRNDKRKVALSIDTSLTDPSTGETYAREALQGWLQHRTQGSYAGWSLDRIRPDLWTRVDSDEAIRLDQLPTMFDDVDLRRLNDNAGEDSVSERELAAFGEDVSVEQHVKRARGILPRLRRLQKNWSNGGPPHHKLGLRIEALERVVLLGSDVRVRASLAQSRLAPGSKVNVRVEVEAPGKAMYGVTVGDRFHAMQPDGNEERVALELELQVPLDATPDQFWPAEFRPHIRLELTDIAIPYRPVLRYTVVPWLRLAWSRDTVLMDAARDFRPDLALDVEWNRKGPANTSLRIVCPPGVTATTTPRRLELDGTKRKARVQVRLQRNGGPVPAGWSPVVTAHLDYLSGKSLLSSLGGGTAALQVQRVECARPEGLHVGLIRGVDDTLETALRDLGVEHEVLDESALAKADLSKFTVIVLDIRVYRTRRDLRVARDRILEYCRAGGRVVCFYHKPGEWNAKERRPLLAPYPLEVGTARVCEQDVAVTLLDPSHPMWNVPNKIRATDFDGWVQERGLNFPKKWDRRWVPMVSMADKGEDPHKGALLLASYGRGSYVYCSLALYRQLRIGHAGVVRLLMNLLQH